MSMVPKLRFPEFDGEWEETTLSEQAVSLDSQRKPVKSSERRSGPFPYYGASGIIDYIDDYIFDEETVLLAEDGANIINRSLPISFIARGKYWVNNHAHVYRAKHSSVFLSISLERLDFQNYNTGTTMPKLNAKTCASLPLIVPTPDEQQKIASFLSSVDKKIYLLRQKKDALELYKKGLMQKIFSQEIRFKQDDGSDFPDWEEMRLEEIADMKAGKFIKASEISPTNQYGFFPCYGGNGLRGYVRTSNQEGRYVLIGRQGALCGNVAITTGKFYATEHAVVTSAKSGNEIDWLFYQLEKMDLNQYAIGVAQPGLSVTSLNSLSTLVPSRSEQAKIASFLSTIDTKIASVASQLEQMESFKKGLLQQMFV